MLTHGRARRGCICLSDRRNNLPVLCLYGLLIVARQEVLRTPGGADVAGEGPCSKSVEHFDIERGVCRGSDGAGNVEIGLAGGLLPVEQASGFGESLKKRGLP